MAEETSPREYTLRMQPPTDVADAEIFYSNFVQANMTQHDMTLHFGWYMTPPLTGEPPDGQTEIEVPVLALAKVVIPLGLVRGLAKVLAAQGDAWEEAHKQKLPDASQSPGGDQT